MNTIVCNGLDGANPLHFLASLGLLRLADRIAPDARLGWRMADGAWRPVLEVDREPSVLLGDLAAWLNALARTDTTSPKLNARVRKSGTLLKKAREAAKDQRRLAKVKAQRAGLSGADAKRQVAAEMAESERAMDHLAQELSAAREVLASSLGTGIAHYGDVIGVDSVIVRRAAAAAVLGFLDAQPTTETKPDDPALLVAQLAALACDQVGHQGRVTPTRFSFSNGAGGQCLLKDFRALAERVNTENIRASIEGRPDRLVEGITGLNWDPGSNRSYALNWRNPEGDPKRTDVAANALAYVGLGLLTAMPTGGRLTPSGWGPGDGWTWPIWEPLLSLPVVRALLADSALAAKTPDQRSLRARGVNDVRRSDRFDPTGQGRPYFAPSRPA